MHCFVSVGKAALTMFRVSTGDDWVYIMQQCGVRPPLCGTTVSLQPTSHIDDIYAIHAMQWTCQAQLQLLPVWPPALTVIACSWSMYRAYADCLVLLISDSQVSVPLGCLPAATFDRLLMK